MLNFKVLLTVLFTLLPTLSFACVSAVVSTREYIEIGMGGKVNRIVYLDLLQASNESRSAEIKIKLQNYLDVRIPLTNLSGEDPDKTTDPVRPDLFWDGGDLVGRGCIITAVTWDGQRYVVSISRAR